MLLNAQNLPELGAQIWIEPGDSDEQIDLWFKTLSNHNLKVGRLFIMWNYVEPTPGNWDFSLYDKAFTAANKYSIKIIATLTTNRRAAHRGDYYQLHGHKLEDTWGRLDESKIYIEKVVDHWKNHPALESWMLTNEASQSPDYHPLAVDRYKGWLKDKYKEITVLNKEWSTWFSSFDEIEPSNSWTSGRGYWIWEPAFLDFHYFWQEHLSWWLEWIAKEVRKHDSKTDIHAHSGGVTGNLASGSYDLSRWNSFTNTLGVSIHPSWHFGLFARDQFPLAISYCAELIRGASSPNPFWVTELQGGQNIFSGGPYPLSPTENDIAQWTWTSVFSGAQKTIYWLLNNRSKGFEVNEWSMLDFHSKPTERIKTAGEIAKVIEENAELFANAKKLNAKITILISLETLTHELYSPDRGKVARSELAHILSVYSYYQTFLELGVPVNIKYMNDFDWNNQNNHLAIVPHAMAVTKKQSTDMTNFVKQGNKLLISGLTALIDETSENWVQREWPLKDVIGANFKDCRLIADSVSINMTGPELNLPGVNWVGELEVTTAKPIGRQNNRIAATKNNYGKGEAVFIPTTLGLAAWQGVNKPLSDYLSIEYHERLSDVPVKFAVKQDKVILETLQSGEKYIVMVTNGKMQPVSVELLFNDQFQPKVIWGNKSDYQNNFVTLNGRETMVLILE